MTRDQFDGQYEVLKPLTTAGVRSFAAVGRSTRRAVMVHFVDGGATGANAHVLELIESLGGDERARVLDLVDVDGTPVVITTFIREFTTLNAWLLSAIAAAPPRASDPFKRSAKPPASADIASAPTQPMMPAFGPASGQKPGEFTQMFAPVKPPEPSPLPVTRAAPPAAPAPPQPPVSAAKPGEFTSLFGAIKPPEPAPVVAPPGPPAEPPRAPQSTAGGPGPTDEFDRLFKAPAPPPPTQPSPALNPPAPAALPPTAEAGRGKAGDFTRLFSPGTPPSTPTPSGTPATGGTTPAPPAPPPASGTEEFDRLFRSGPGASATPTAPDPASTTAPRSIRPEPAPPSPPRGVGGSRPGDFTALFSSAAPPVTPGPVEPESQITQPRIPPAAEPRPAMPPGSPDDLSRRLGRGLDAPAQPPAATGSMQAWPGSSPPGEAGAKKGGVGDFTRMFGMPAYQDVPPAPQAPPPPSPVTPALPPAPPPRPVAEAPGSRPSAEYLARLHGGHAPPSPVIPSRPAAGAHAAASGPGAFTRALQRFSISAQTPQEAGTAEPGVTPSRTRFAVVVGVVGVVVVVAIGLTLYFALKGP